MFQNSVVFSLMLCILKEMAVAGLDSQPRAGIINKRVHVGGWMMLALNGISQLEETISNYISS